MAFRGHLTRTNSLKESDSFGDILSFVRSHYQTPLSEDYALYLVCSVLNSPDSAIPIRSWEDYFEYASCARDYDPAEAFYVRTGESREKLRTVTLKWVCKISAMMYVGQRLTSTYKAPQIAHTEPISFLLKLISYQYDQYLSLPNSKQDFLLALNVDPNSDSEIQQAVELHTAMSLQHHDLVMLKP